MNLLRPVTLREIYACPLIAGIVANLAVGGFHRVFPELLGFHMSRVLILSKALLDLAVLAPVYAVLLIALRQVTATDWKNFVGFTAFGSEFLRHPLRERVKIYR
jgi:hypothetical protein